MIAKEKAKAKELVSKFEVWTSRSMQAGFSKYDAKQCALIAGNEIIEYLHYVLSANEYSSCLSFWNEVKKEIEKL